MDAEHCVWLHSLEHDADSIKGQLFSLLLTLLNETCPHGGGAN